MSLKNSTLELYTEYVGDKLYTGLTDAGDKLYTGTYLQYTNEKSFHRFLLMLASKLTLGLAHSGDNLTTATSLWRLQTLRHPLAYGGYTPYGSHLLIAVTTLRQPLAYGGYKPYDIH